MTRGPGWDAVDVARAFRALERGSTTQVRDALRAVDDSRPPTTAAGRVARLLARTLEGPPRRPQGPGAAQRDVEAVPPASIAAEGGVPRGTEGHLLMAEHELEAAATALEHVLAARSALRSGLTDELARETRAAHAGTPPRIPWLTLRCGSLYQACYRFTGLASHRRSALDVARPIADRVEIPHLAVTARAMLGSVHLLAGDLHAALDRCDAALELARAEGLGHTPASAHALQFRAYVLAEWTRLDEAEDALLQAWDAAGSEGHATRSGVARVLSEIATVRGDGATAERWLARLEQTVAEPMSLRNREWLAAVRMSTRPGATAAAEARDWLTRYDYSASAIASAPAGSLRARLHELSRVLTYLEAAGRWTELLAIGDAVAGATEDERRWFGAQALGAAAVACEGLGRSNEADERMTRALELGIAGSLVRAYVGPSRVRGHLLARLRGGTLGAEAARVVEACPELGATAPAGDLTPRQSQVLHRVALGESNKSIARALGISVNTVRTHLRVVFDRFDVTSRTQAVARARSLGLIDQD